MLRKFCIRRKAGQEYCHNDALDVLWNMLDRTPEGRGDFHPKLEYGQPEN